MAAFSSWRGFWNYSIQLDYSHLFNSGGGWNKRGEGINKEVGIFFGNMEGGKAYQINEEGDNFYANSSLSIFHAS